MSYSQIFERLNNQNKSKFLSFLGNWIPSKMLLRLLLPYSSNTISRKKSEQIT